MSRGIFDKWRAGSRGKRDERGPFAAVDAPASTDLAAGLDSNAPMGTSIDESMLLLSRELSALGSLPVSTAAKERGWASLQREMERHPLKVASTSTSKSKPAARPRTLRVAIGSAVGVVAMLAAVLGSYSGGLLQTADNGDNPTTVTSVVSSETTLPDTTPSVTPSTVPATDPTVTTDGGTVSTDGGSPSGTTGPAVTDGTVSTAGTQPSTPVSTQPSTANTTANTPGTTSGSGSAGSSTTQPPRTTTTGEQQMAAAQRIGSAQAAVVYLADLVITGNTSGALALVAPAAQAGLAQMIASLSDPNGYKVTGAQTLSDGTVRVSLQISDRVVNNAGEPVEQGKGFVIRVRVDGENAVITAINAGS